MDESGEIFDQWLNWFVKRNNVAELWEHQPTYLLSQALFLYAGFATLIHSLVKGGRWPWLWLTIFVHGLVADNVWHFLLPDFDNFWHSQTPVIFLGNRLPLHIILLYPAFIYTATYALSRLFLPLWSEPFAVGLLTVLIDLPYDIVSVKFLHWTWHDTDPNVYDRHYWVPWNSYYFHSTFAASLVFIFHGLRQWMSPKTEKWLSAGFGTEFKAFLLTALLAMPGGILLFIPIYHPLHDIAGVHSEVTFMILASIFLMLAICGLMRERTKPTGITKADYLLIYQLLAHYVLFWAMTIWANPENEISVGLHEPVGPCKEMTTLTTPFGSVLQKRKYLCIDNFDEGYFDFHCVPGNQQPRSGSDWYTICGTPFENRTEYIVITTAMAVVGLGIFFALFFNTAVEKKIPQKFKKH